MQQKFNGLLLIKVFKVEATLYLIFWMCSYLELLEKKDVAYGIVVGLNLASLECTLLPWVRFIVKIHLKNLTQYRWTLINWLA